MLGEGIRFAHDGQLRTVAYVEREACAAATLVARMDDKALDQAPVWDDVKRLTDQGFLEYVRQFHPLIVSGGYPCQPFSLAGSRLGEADERHLWPAIDAFIGAAMPELCFFENVPGHVSIGLATVIGNLRERGYRVAAGLFSAAEVGASHERLRLFILGVLENARGFDSRQGRAEPEGQQRSTAFDDADSPLANPENSIWRQLQQGRRTQGGIASQGASGELADASVTRRQEPAQEDDERWRMGSEPELGRYDTELAYAEEQGFQGRIATRNCCPDGCASQCGELPLFAPGPADGRWHEILAAFPQVEPAVCRVADGMASGMDADRLRLTGNGVVPLAAAYAFVTLVARLCGYPE